MFVIWDGDNKVPGFSGSTSKAVFSVVVVYIVYRFFNGILQDVVIIVFKRAIEGITIFITLL